MPAGPTNGPIDRAGVLQGVGLVLLHVTKDLRCKLKLSVHRLRNFRHGEPPASDFLIKNSDWSFFKYVHRLMTFRQGEETP